MADTTLGLVLSENDDEACSAEQARELAEVGAVNDPERTKSRLVKAGSLRPLRARRRFVSTCPLASSKGTALVRTLGYQY